MHRRARAASLQVAMSASTMLCGQDDNAAPESLSLPATDSTALTCSVSYVLQHLIKPAGAAPAVAQHAHRCGINHSAAPWLQVREKDGLWAVLAWLSILAHKNKEVPEGSGKLVGVEVWFRCAKPVQSAQPSSICTTHLLHNGSDCARKAQDLAICLETLWDEREMCVLLWHYSIGTTGLHCHAGVWAAAAMLCVCSSKGCCDCVQHTGSLVWPMLALLPLMHVDRDRHEAFNACPLCPQHQPWHIHLRRQGAFGFSQGGALQDVAMEHWGKFGRNFFMRYDYEGVESDKANKVRRCVMCIHCNARRFVGSMCRGEGNFGLEGVESDEANKLSRW